MRTSLLLFFSTIHLFLSAQHPVMVHSHNDYKQDIPFWRAFAAGANSIEVDLILKDGKLYVAHEEATIKPNHTFEELYLKPLERVKQLHEETRLNLQLLVDVKTEAETTLREIIKTLEPYKMLCQPLNPSGVTITISGHRPAAKDYKNYPDHIFFDCQEMHQTPDEAWEKVAMISTSFKNLSWWNGLGRMVKEDRERVKTFIEKAREHHKPIRFWATPDTKTAWKNLSKLGVDYINTDAPEKTISYFKSLAKNTYLGKAQDTLSYRPSFAHDPTAKKVKNVILLIGDGMGLSQISAGDLLAHNKFHITQLNSIGLIRTQAADNFGTDSAAGATAYATGVQTNNRAIGTDSQEKKLANITEILSQKGYSTAIITTDNITGATPAAFYAHVKERDDEKTILQDLANSKLDFFAAAGNGKFKNYSTKLGNKYKVLDFTTSLEFPDNERIGLFLSEKNLLPAKLGRGNIMPQLVRKVLPYLKAKEKPFFIMVEGAKIDSYGHGNDMEGVVEELFDFDAMVAEALQFADLDGETLVLITADHETGGLSLLDADLENQTMEGYFTTNDHTGCLVPIFAYGPGASSFQGIYQNYELNHKILDILSN